MTRIIFKIFIFKTYILIFTRVHRIVHGICAPFVIDPDSFLSGVLELTLAARVRD